MRVLVLFVCLLWTLLAPPLAQAKSVRIDVDTSGATRLLAIACSGKPVDAAEFSSSRLLRHQLDHHRGFGEVYSLDNYITGLRAVADCKVPDPDPFRMRYLVENRDKMRHAIEFLANNRERIGREASALIAPYVPSDMDYSGSVVLAAASFSRGGFASGGAFFIDIAGLSEDIEADYEAMVRLIAHETYHAIQHRLSDARPPSTTQSATDKAIRQLFDGLAFEGSASFVGDTTRMKTTGPYGQFSLDEAKRGLGRLPQTAALLNFGVELLGTRADDERLDSLYGLIFGGRVGQPGYYLGQHMSAEIVQNFGASALPCLLQRHPEYFILAYRQAGASGTPLQPPVPLGADTLRAAERLAGAGWQARLAECLGTKS